MLFDCIGEWHIANFTCDDLRNPQKESPLLRYDRPLSRSSTFPKRQAPSSPATTSTPRGVRLQPLNIDSSAANDAAADGDGEMELFKRSTPRYKQALLLPLHKSMTQVSSFAEFNIYCYNLQNH